MRLERRAVAKFSLQADDQTIADYKTILDKYPNAENSENCFERTSGNFGFCKEASAEFSDYFSKNTKEPIQVAVVSNP